MERGNEVNPTLSKNTKTRLKICSAVKNNPEKEENRHNLVSIHEGNEQKQPEGKFNVR